MTETLILDKSGNTRLKVVRKTVAQTNFRIGSESFPDELSGLRCDDDVTLIRQRCRATLNRAFLSQRPVHGGKALPVAVTAQDLHLIEILSSDPDLKFGRTDISLTIRSGRWDGDAIFARQPHAAWMRLVDERIGARRGAAANALRDYWRLLCLEMPDLAPERDAEVTVRMPKGPSGLPVLIADGVIFHALQVGVPDLVEMALRHGGRGFVSVGPSPSRGEGSIELSLVALTASSASALERCVQFLPEASLI